MINITILCVGKIKERYFEDACREYEKRLSRYAKVEIREVKDEKTPEEASLKEEEEIKDIEGKRLIKLIPPDSHVIALAINGKTFDSPGMAKNRDTLMTAGKSRLCFIIGGSLGLSDEVLRSAKEHWSFSSLTFPHQLMRVFLLEQLYRSFRILHNEPYHK